MDASEIQQSIQDSVISWIKQDQDSDAGADRSILYKTVSEQEKAESGG